ncbi:Na/Pi symporter [Aquabacterium sp. A7-Y]|uniref:Na/Pi cotransporter family protein n=1 Tax=Aquabacterium sp. A7-Y TaxID=1349605 RepID=UPI00223E6C60|nr:Na/Pi symporter [Aquabacterium sp. A7-Y]MCW7539943.1 Na/Pi symporter [Aquabacterium sp. A7-Y]
MASTLRTCIRLPSCPASGRPVEALGRISCGIRPAVLALLAGSVPSTAFARADGSEIDWISMGSTFVAGLVLFLWGVRALSQRLREVGSERLREILRRSSDNRLRGLLCGTGVTLVLDSSSATIVLLIALVDAGLLGFAASLPIILGSNIGTTFSSQLFALNAEALPPLLMAGGLGGVLLGRSVNGRRWGEVVFGVGMVLFALHVIGLAMEPLGDHAGVKDWLRNFEQPLLGLAAGAAATVAIQSSSAMMGIVIVMASQQLISLETGLALMLGAEIGTCADTLVASLGRSAAALRAGLFHLGFNIASALLGLMLIGPMAWFAQASAGTVAQQIANAHVAFNVIGALLFFGFTGLIARWLQRLLPDRVHGPLNPPVAKGPALDA